MSKRLVI